MANITRTGLISHLLKQQPIKYMISKSHFSTQLNKQVHKQLHRQFYTQKFSIMNGSTNGLIKSTISNRNNSLITIHKRNFNLPLYCVGACFLMDDDMHEIGIAMIIVAIFL